MNPKQMTSTLLDVEPMKLLLIHLLPFTNTVQPGEDPECFVLRFVFEVEKQGVGFGAFKFIRF